MNNTTILRCTCTNKFQDKRYGVNQRLYIMKQRTRGKGANDWTCTVCGKVQTK